MYHQLQLKDSLYIIGEHELRRFKQLANSIVMDVPLTQLSPVQPKDNWGMVFNNWLYCYEQEKRFVMDFSKAEMYSCNFYCAELFRASEDLKLLFKRYVKTEELCFILSYYLGYELLIWTYELLSSVEQGRSLIQKNYERDYFYLMDDDSILLNNTHEHFLDQKLMTSLMGQNYRYSDDFKQHMDKAIQATLNQYNRLKSVSF